MERNKDAVAKFLSRARKVKKGVENKIKIVKRQNKIIEKSMIIFSLRIADKQVIFNK